MRIRLTLEMDVQDDGDVTKYANMAANAIRVGILVTALGGINGIDAVRVVGLRIVNLDNPEHGE